MYIMDLLTADNRCPELAGALAAKRVKITRHVLGSERQTIRDWIGHDLAKFNIWQGRQKDIKRVFHNCDFVVSCVGLHPGTQGLFVGVYRNKSGDDPRLWNEIVRGNGLAKELDSKTLAKFKRFPHCFYDLCREPGFADLERRVKIEWASPGKKASAQAWVQCAKTHRKRADKSLRDAIWW